MSFNAIYFPYIRVPNSQWFTQVLLYWDQVASIVPYEFAESPGRLGRHTTELIQEGLVKQIFPGAMLWRVNNFGNAFLEYVDIKYPPSHRTYTSDWSLQSANKAEWPLVHMEKLQDVGHELCQRQLAYPETGRYSSWFRVEPKVANDFMAYLAGILGQMPDESKYSPITDLSTNLAPFAPINNQPSTASSIRRLILEQIIPVPSNEVSAADLVDFKKKYKEPLARFRRHVESKISELSAINDSQSRSSRLNYMTDEFRQTIDELTSRMLERKGWNQISFSTLCTITGAGLSGYKAILDGDWRYGASAAALSVAPAIYSALRSPELSIGTEPLAYAVLAGQHLSDSN